MTASGEVEFLNRPVLEYFGKTLDELKSWPSGNEVHADDLPGVLLAWNRSVSTGELYEIEHRLRRFDGVYRWFQARGLAERRADGEIVRWYLLLTDVEDRKRSEEIARQSHLTIRSIIDSIPGYVHTMRADGSVEFVNQRILDFFQKTTEELSDWAPLIHPEDREVVISQWYASIAAGEPYDQMHRVCRADGEWRWFHSRGLPLRDASGQIVRWCNLLVDIDERKKAEEALRSRERELGEIIETIPGLVWCASPDGELTYVNRRILDYLGVERNELLSGGWVHYMHPDDLPAAIASWSHSVASGEAFEGLSRLRGTDGAYRWFHSLCHLGRDPEGNPARWYGVMINVDEGRRIEEALKSTREQLSRAAQVATLGELSASIAHEVNQPLAAVVTNGYACLRWLGAQPPNLMKAQEAVERVVRDGKEAGEVVKRIRALFRRTEDQRVELDLNSVILEVVSLISSETVRQQISVAMELHEGLLAVLGDRVQFQQLILNILINSIEAMSFVKDRPKRIVVRSKSEGSETVLVEIVDSGAGFKQADPIFDAFFSTKKTGMGMGLAICRSIVESHQGQIWAANAPGSGAMFCFRLPSARSGS